jgi:hypothetical protein
MTHHVSPPVDQRIVDDYFKLCKSKKNNKLAWFYGMLATFGVKPDQLKQFKWNEDGTINIPSRKKPVRPMHPQWVFLFGLKEKQPSNIEDCWNNAWLLIYQAMACKEIECNIIELLIAYKIRKAFYSPKRLMEKKFVRSPEFSSSHS